MKTNTPPLIPHHRSHTTPPLLLFTEQTPEGFSATMSPDPDFTGGPSSTDIFRIDDLLDFSNEDLFPSTSSTTDTNTTTDTNHHFPLFDLSTTTTTTTSFPHDFCLPSEDVAELEWLSNFVDDSFSNFPVNNFTTPTTAAVSITSVPAKARTKRSKPTLTHHSWTSLPDHNKCKPFTKDEASSSTTAGGGRKCTHCASERTPQWRTGPMGPKTLCNACGVRYKSGRLVPEYRPAASPTFMLTRHSNSHRKVLELRRQKEVGVEDGSNGNCHEFFQHHHDYKIC